MSARARPLVADVRGMIQEGLGVRGEVLPEGRTNEEEVRLIRGDPAGTVAKFEASLAKPHAQAVEALG
jgi:hypothetical protein